MRVLIRFVDYCKLNSVDLYSEGNLFSCICEDFKYLPIELFLKRYSMLIYPNSSKLELEIFINKFFDVNKNEILFQEEFYEVIEINLRSILSVMKSLSIGVQAEKEKKDKEALSVSGNVSALANNNTIDNSTNILDENILKQLNAGI